MEWKAGFGQVKNEVTWTEAYNVLSFLQKEQSSPLIKPTLALTT